VISTPDAPKWMRISVASLVSQATQVRISARISARSTELSQTDFRNSISR
jgi:hypothetical protein